MNSESIGVERRIGGRIGEEDRRKDRRGGQEEG